MTDGCCAILGGWTNQKDLTFDGFKGVVTLITHKKDGLAKSGYFDGIFGCFGALRGSPGVMDG